LTEDPTNVSVRPCLACETLWIQVGCCLLQKIYR